MTEFIKDEVSRFFTGVLYGLVFGAFVVLPATAFSEWTPLISASDFTGIRTDILTAVAGLMSVILIVLGVGILIRVLSR